MEGHPSPVASVTPNGPLTYTIVTRSHFHLAAALESQFRAANPEGRFLVVVADADDPSTAAADWEWLAPVHREWRAAIQDRRCGSGRGVVSARQVLAEEFWPLAFQYLPLELTCCLKGRVATALLADGEDRLLYLDADTQIFQPVDQCLAPIWETGGVLLTPHRRGSLPADGCYPSELDLLRSGGFNAGVMGFVQTAESAAGVQAFLGWWNQCTARDCVVDLPQGLFVDQRWLDAAPPQFPWLSISQHPGLNVGYWNLHERSVRRGPQVWEVDSSLTGPQLGADRGTLPRPLQVFHFSGAALVDQDGRRVGHRLSRYQNRHALGDHPAVANLLETYLAAWDRHDWRHYASIPYAYQQLSNGEPIPLVWREAFRQDLGKIRGQTDNPFIAFSHEPGRRRIQAAADVRSLKGGRSEIQLTSLRARLERLQRRLDRQPWRRLLRATRAWKNRWLRKAG